MSSFCQSGDTAKVTFPNGSIQNFSDTPISITCETQYENCRRYTIRIRWQRNGTNGLPTGNIALNDEIHWSTDNVSNFATRIIFLNGTWNAQIYSKGVVSTCGVEQWRTFTTSNFNFHIFEITSVTPFQNSPLPKRRIKVIGASGTELHNSLYDNCDYLVECLQGCPPNSLDCGDCCLNCDSVFNKISSIRALVKGLK